MLLKTKWHNNKDLIIPGIYAPNISLNDSSSSADFFTTLHDFFIGNLEWRPDYMGGDLNFVEEYQCTQMTRKYGQHLINLKSVMIYSFLSILSSVLILSHLINRYLD